MSPRARGARVVTARIGLAIASACTAAIAIYALLRGGQVLLFPEPDPARVLYSAHAGFFWRAWIAVFTGGTAGFVAWMLAARDSAKVARFLARAIPPAAALLAAQALLAP